LTPGALTAQSVSVLHAARGLARDVGGDRTVAAPSGLLILQVVSEGSVGDVWYEASLADIWILALESGSSYEAVERESSTVVNSVTGERRQLVVTYFFVRPEDLLFSIRLETELGPPFSAEGEILDRLPWVLE
jgi:hypothetical protein